MIKQSRRKQGKHRGLLGMSALFLLLFACGYPQDVQENEQEMEQEVEGVTRREEMAEADPEMDAESEEQAQESLSEIPPEILQQPDSEWEQGTDVTIMVYLDAASLESRDVQLATMELIQMAAADLGQEDRIRVLIETGGTSSWGIKGISTTSTQRYLLQGQTLQLLEDTGVNQDMTDPDTLEEFVTFCSQAAPAERYLLFFWGHGWGPVMGYGQDDYQSADKAMRVDELADALERSGVHFDMITFDVCLMGTLEIAYALRNVCDYLAVSEDYVPAYGQQYTKLFTELCEDPQMNMVTFAKLLVEGFYEETVKSGDRGIMTVFEMAYMEELMEAWLTFVEINREELVDAVHTIWTDESLLIPVPAGTDGYVSDDYLYSLEDYYLTDLQAICDQIPGREANVLTGILYDSITATSSYHMARTMCGLAVCLPYQSLYGDRAYLNRLESVYTELGFDEAYLEMLYQ